MFDDPMAHRLPSTTTYLECSIVGLRYRWMRTPALRSIP